MRERIYGWVEMHGELVELIFGFLKAGTSVVLGLLILASSVLLSVDEPTLEALPEAQRYFFSSQPYLAWGLIAIGYFQLLFHLLDVLHDRKVKANLDSIQFGSKQR